MRIGILVPSIYMHDDAFRKRISAPMELSINLADGLVDAGNEIFFFAGPRIPTKAQVVTCDEELLDKNLVIDYQQDLQSEAYQAVSQYERKKYYELSITQNAYRYAQKEKLDVMHVYHAYGNLAHYFTEILPVPTLFTLHVLPPPQNTFERWRYNRFKNQNFVAISTSQGKEFQQIAPGINIIDTIYHGIEPNSFTQGENPYTYFAFIGRVIPEKGLDIAITVAKELDFELHVATDITPVVSESSYYKEKILPFTASKNIQIKGLLTGLEKFGLLGNAKAMVFPLQWNEPFGMVLIESLSVGTPVVAFGRGSVPEIIADGTTGFLVDPKDGVAGIKKAIQKLNSLSKEDYLQMRKNCIARYQKYFTVQTMVDNYEKVYQKLLAK